MNILELDTRYRAMSDGELLALSADPSQLTAEAQTSLTNELARRHINPNRLSQELREEVKARTENKRDGNPRAIYAFVPELKWLVARTKDWKTFRRQTGRLPILSILAYSFHLGVILCIIVGMIWFTALRRWSGWAFTGTFLLLILVEGYLSDVILGKVRLHEIARYRSRRSPTN